MGRVAKVNRVKWVSPHLLLSSPPTLAQTGSPNHLEKKESGIQVSVWREVLNLGGKVRRGNRRGGEDRFSPPMGFTHSP